MQTNIAHVSHTEPCRGPGYNTHLHPATYQHTAFSSGAATVLPAPTRLPHTIDDCHIEVQKPTMFGEPASPVTRRRLTAPNATKCASPILPFRFQAHEATTPMSSEGGQEKVDGRAHEQASLPFTIRPNHRHLNPAGTLSHRAVHGRSSGRPTS